MFLHHLTFISRTLSLYLGRVDGADVTRLKPCKDFVIRSLAPETCLQRLFYSLRNFFSIHPPRVLSSHSVSLPRRGCTISSAEVQAVRIFSCALKGHIVSSFSIFSQNHFCQTSQLIYIERCQKKEVLTASFCSQDQISSQFTGQCEVLYIQQYSKDNYSALFWCRKRIKCLCHHFI